MATTRKVLTVQEAIDEAITKGSSERMGKFIPVIITPLKVETKEEFLDIYINNYGFKLALGEPTAIPEKFLKVIQSAVDIRSHSVIKDNKATLVERLDPKYAISYLSNQFTGDTED